MLALLIIIIVLFIIALLRFGVDVEYSSEGVTVKILAGPFSLTVFPQKEDTPEQAEKKAHKKALKKSKKEAKKIKAKEKPPFKMPGGIKGFLDMIPPIKNMMRRVKRRIRINNLTIYYTVAGSDASKTAMTYGAVNAALGTLSPLLDDHFRVKHRDFRTSVDFISAEQKIYVNAAISLAVWESVYIAFALFPILKIFLRRNPAKKDAAKKTKKDASKNASKDVKDSDDVNIIDGKEDVENGKTSNQ